MIKENSVSVVLPSYNEKENIGEALERISGALGKNLLEIIVVDDNSPDGTWKIVKEAGEKNKKIKLIHRINEKGLASAIARGVSEAKGSVIVWMDCDLGLPPEFIPNLVEKLNEFDIAIGSRYVAGGSDKRPWFRAAVSRVGNAFTAILLGNYTKDYTSGFAAVKKEVFEKVKINPKGFGEYFIEFIYSAGKNKFRIKELGYEYTDRKAGISKTGSSMTALIKFMLQYFLSVIGIFLKGITGKI